MKIPRANFDNIAHNVYSIIPEYITWMYEEHGVEITGVTFKLVGNYRKQKKILTPKSFVNLFGLLGRKEISPPKKRDKSVEVMRGSYNIRIKPLPKVSLNTHDLPSNYAELVNQAKVSDPYFGDCHSLEIWFGYHISSIAHFPKWLRRESVALYIDVYSDVVYSDGGKVNFNKLSIFRDTNGSKKNTNKRIGVHVLTNPDNQDNFIEKFGRNI